MISVALCTYNGEKYLPKQLDSILNQTKTVDEIVICDDFSTDLTFEILKIYEKTHAGLFKIYKNDIRLNTVKNFEKAISLCSGDYIFLSDQDDVWKDYKVSRMIDFFKKNDKCLLLFSNGELIDRDNRSLFSTLWEKWDFNQIMQEYWMNNHNQMIDLIQNNNKVTGATICLKKELLDELIPINLPIGIWHDSYMALHAAAKNGLYFINENLIEYRIHENQQVGITSGGNTKQIGGISLNDYKLIVNNKFPDYIKYYNLKFEKSKLSFYRRIKMRICKIISKCIRK